MKSTKQHPLSILSKIIFFWLIATTTLSAQAEQFSKERPTTILPRQGFTGHVVLGLARFSGDIAAYLPQNQFIFGVQCGYIYKNVVATAAFYGTGDYDLKQNFELKGRTWGSESGVGVFPLQLSLGYQFAFAKHWLATPFISYNNTVLEINERLVGDKYYDTPIVKLESQNFSGGVNIDWVFHNSFLPPMKSKNKEWHVLTALRTRIEYSPNFSLTYNQGVLKSTILNVSVGFTTTVGRNRSSL